MVTKSESRSKACRLKINFIECVPESTGIHKQNSSKVSDYPGPDLEIPKNLKPSSYWVSITVLRTQ